MIILLTNRESLWSRHDHQNFLSFTRETKNPTQTFNTIKNHFLHISLILSFHCPLIVSRTRCKGIAAGWRHLPLLHLKTLCLYCFFSIFITFLKMADNQSWRWKFLQRIFATETSCCTLESKGLLFNWDNEWTTTANHFSCFHSAAFAKNHNSLRYTPSFTLFTSAQWSSKLFWLYSALTVKTVSLLS